ncbi:MAG: siderophore-interacting protein [Pseudomonadota bacterium]
MARQDNPLMLKVIKNQRIGDLYQRLTLTHEDLDEKRVGKLFQGLHVKLFFTTANQTKLTLPYRQDGKIVWPAKRDKPVTRTYSIYDYNPTTKLLQIDFLRHEEEGIACEFAKNATVGDMLGFAGPGPIKMIDATFDKFLLIGDLTGLPAIASVAKTIPQDAQPTIIIEVEHEHQISIIEDYYFGSRKCNVSFVPLHYEDKSSLLDMVDKLNISEHVNEWSIAVAAEHNTVLSVRTYLRTINLSRHQLYAVPYWKYQQDEETYHEERHEVMDS